MLRRLTSRLTAPRLRQIPNGYSAAEISDVVVAKTAAAIASGAPEQFAPATALHPTLLAVSMWAPKTVLDFGGAAGFHYYASARILDLSGVRWAVVEHPLMVERTAKFETRNLRFFQSIDDAVGWLQAPVDLLHSNGALQYLPSPENTVTDLLHLNPGGVVWSRVLLGERRDEEEQRALLSQYGPGSTPPADKDAEVVSRVVRMDEAAFLKQHANYRLRWRTSDTFYFERAD